MQLTEGGQLAGVEVVEHAVGRCRGVLRPVEFVGLDLHAVRRGTGKDRRGEVQHESVQGTRSSAGQLDRHVGTLTGLEKSLLGELVLVVRNATPNSCGHD